VREVQASTVGIFTHEHSKVRTVSGSWDGDASSGMVLVVNAEPYDVELQRGDVVAAAYAVPATQDEGQAAVAAATAGVRGPQSLPPDVAHIVEKPGAIDAMMETELPPQEYYTALRKDLAERFPAADTFLLDHLVSLEELLDVSIVSGFSLSVDKSQVAQLEVTYIGDKIGRDGWVQ